MLQGRIAKKKWSDIMPRLFDMHTLDEREKYRILTSCIVPRPIAWVTTMDSEGICNAAPFSFFTGVSIEPPLVIFAVERRHGKKKDTVINIEQTNEFVINIVTVHNVQQMNETSRDFTVGENEFEKAGLTAIPSHTVIPPSIGESPIHLECVLDRIIEIGSSPHSLVIGEVKLISVDSALLKDERVDMKELEVVGRMGGKYYLKSDALFELERLDWRHKTV